MGQANSRQEEFWEACSYGREWLVKLMLEEGNIDVNWTSNISDCAPIHVASQGNIKIVKHLINAKCLIDARDLHGNTALHHAAIAGKADVCELLIEAGADIDAINNNGWTPLFNACYWCRVDVANVLISRHADYTIRNKDGRTCLHELCRSKCKDIEQEVELVSILNLLIDAGCSLSQKCEPNDKTAKNTLEFEADFSPLLFATYHCHIPMVKRMLEIDCDIVDNVDINGWTALHWAAQRGSVELVEMLLIHGSDPESYGKRNETPATVTNNVDIYRILTDPSCFPYPHIESNGPVSTDDEEDDNDQKNKKSSRSSSLSVKPKNDMSKESSSKRNNLKGVTQKKRLPIK